MILLTPELHAALRANADARQVAQARYVAEPDPRPVVKFFNPVGAATWLATELDTDDDTLFGLADLGFGTPELGSFSLSELASVRLPFGLGIERDIGFTTPFRLSVWTGFARRAGSILTAEALLRRASPRAAIPIRPPIPAAAERAALPAQVPTPPAAIPNEEAGPVHSKEQTTMQLANIDIGKLSISTLNMRHGKTAPDVSDILPSIRARGVLVPLLVRPSRTPMSRTSSRRRRPSSATFSTGPTTAKKSSAGCPDGWPSRPAATPTGPSANAYTPD